MRGEGPSVAGEGHVNEVLFLAEVTEGREYARVEIIPPEAVLLFARGITVAGRLGANGPSRLGPGPLVPRSPPEIHNLAVTESGARAALTRLGTQWSRPDKRTNTLSDDLLPLFGMSSAQTDYPHSSQVLQKFSLYTININNYIKTFSYFIVLNNLKQKPNTIPVNAQTYRKKHNREYGRRSSIPELKSRFRFNISVSGLSQWERGENFHT